MSAIKWSICASGWKEKHHKRKLLRCKLEWAAPTRHNYSHHHHQPDQHQHRCRWSDRCSNQDNLCKDNWCAFTQVALIAASVTPIAYMLVLIWSVVVVVVVVAYYWCSPLQLALKQLALAVFLLPSIGANTPLAHMVMITCCNLHWWYIFYH